MGLLCSFDADHLPLCCQNCPSTPLCCRLDESYRNDLGFLYCLHLEGPHPKSLELVPTKISHVWRHETTRGGRAERPPYFSFVNRATGQDRAWLAATVRRLSAAFGTPLADTPRGLIIPLAKP